MAAVDERGTEQESPLLELEALDSRTRGLRLGLLLRL